MNNNIIEINEEKVKDHLGTVRLGRVYNHSLHVFHITDQDSVEPDRIIITTIFRSRT